MAARDPGHRGSRSGPLHGSVSRRFPARHSPGRGLPASRRGDEDLRAAPASPAAAAGRLHCLTTAWARLAAGKPASGARKSPAAAAEPHSPFSLKASKSSARWSLSANSVFFVRPYWPNSP
ncbi:hypothetical protein NN561_013054 [Cricetulus griseus]